MKIVLNAVLLFVFAAMLPTSVYAGPVVAWVFVNPATGNDATCNSQPSADGNIIAPAIGPGTVPCKTFTRACAILPADAGNWVIEGEPGFDVENVVCNASGHDPLNPLNIIGRNPGPGGGGGGPLYLKSPNSRPAWEMTGNFVYLNKIDFRGSPGDAVYVHGRDSAHNAVDNVIGYNTSFDANGGYAVHADYTYWFLMFGDNVYNNGANSNGCILVESSTFWLVTNTGITNCGAISGTPSTPKPGLIATQTSYGQYVANTAMQGASPSLQLNDSFNVLAVRDATKPAQQHFTFQVNSAKGPAEATAELASDTIVGN
jgi:hypothetical protein